MSETLRIVLINGPPRAGKDTLAQQLQRLLDPLFNVTSVRIGFADHLKRLVHTVYNIPDAANPFALEAVKDISHPLMYGQTPRQAYIHFSEKVLKPLHGSRFFGDALVRTVRSLHPLPSIVFIPDSGFADEAMSVIEAFSPANCLLLRLHRTGTDFATLRDSRSYIDLSHLHVETDDIVNTSDHPDRMTTAALKVLTTKWIDFSQL